MDKENLKTVKSKIFNTDEKRKTFMHHEEKWINDQGQLISEQLLSLQLNYY
jgi:hypothetical protein